MHLKKQGLPRERVLAAVVHLLEKTLIRVGNEEYARENRSYELTTMLDQPRARSGQALSREEAAVVELLERRLLKTA